jgi:hypothetical protein
MFLNPAFLLAMAAAAIPLWLHLSRKRKYREMPVGTLRFLNEALRERKRKSRIEEIPLLLLRMAAMALLAFVFARPFFLRAEKGAEKATQTIILLDASGSITPEMAEAARDAATNQLSKTTAGEVKLAQFSDGVQLLDSISAYRPTAGAGTKLDGALGWALDQLLIDGSKAGKVVLISHLASESLPAEPPRVWPPQVALELVPIAPPSVDNAAVRRVSLLTPYVTGEMEIEALVWLPRSRATPEARTVTLEAEGLRQTAVVPPGSERVVFRFHPPREEVRGWISIAGDDAWPADDRRPFAVRWTEPARVLLVDGQPGNTPFEGQAYFIEKALSASGAAHGKSPFKPEIVFALEGRSGAISLDGVRAVALCGVTDLSPASARSLSEFVAKGGGLISVLNEKWTNATTMPLVEAGLFPDAIALTGGEEKFRLAHWDRTHPALAMFDGREGGDLRSLPWRGGFSAQAGHGWKALATLENNQPLLLAKEGGDGKPGPVLVCTHPLNREWSDVPREPEFVPLVKNCFMALGHVEAAPPEPKLITPGIQEQRPIGYHLVEGQLEVVAPDASESLVATASEPAFRAAFGLPDAHATVIAPPAPERTEQRSRPGEFWPWLLLAVLLLLAVENIVATRAQPTTSSAS